MSIFIAWFSRAIMFGTVIMFGSMGEIITEKSGNLNLGVPGIMYLGGFAGFVSSFYYGNYAENKNAFVCILIACVSSFMFAALGGLVYSFLTITLRANQNVTGLALTIFGTGFSNVLGSFLMKDQVYAAARYANSIFRTKIFGFVPGKIGELFFSYGFLAYLAIIVAVLIHLFLNKTKAGLNLRAVGESPATADAAGVNIAKYKYLAICIGSGISGLGGLYYSIDYNNGIWSTTSEIESLGWLAVALVIFTTWKSLNAVWGAYLFGFFYWLYQYLPGILGVTIPNYSVSLAQMVPYVVTIFVLVITSLRKKREQQPPASLGLPYFREER